MSIIIFEDRGWLIATSSWTIGGKGKKSRLIYEWGPDSISWFDGAVSTCVVHFDIPANELINIIRDRTRNGICDLRQAEGCGE